MRAGLTKRPGSGLDQDDWLVRDGEFSIRNANCRDRRFGG